MKSPAKTVQPVKIKVNAVNFNRGKLTSDAVLLRQVDQNIRLTEHINAIIHLQLSTTGATDCHLLLTTLALNPAKPERVSS